MAEPLQILLASDFTARSDRPLDRALLLARAPGAKLTIAHVLDSKQYERLGGDLAAIKTALRADLPETCAETELVVRVGSTPHALAEIAAESGSDLIVCGVARYNNLGDFFLGTAVDHIVRHAEVPVLVVRKRPLRAYQRLLVATDFSDCSRAALLTAAQLLPDTQITLVHAFHVPYEGWLKSEAVHDEVVAEEREDMDGFLASPATGPELRARITALNVEGDLGAVIHRQLKESDADLVVLGTHGRSGFAHAMIGSNAAELLSSVDSDVLLVRERKRPKG